jgi:hypothetical protein
MNRRLILAVMVLSLGALQGCVTHQFLPMFETALAPVPHRVVTMWENRVIVTENVVNEGADLPGLAGRVYFFANKIGNPLTVNGDLFVTAHEILPDGKKVPMEMWHFDATKLPTLGSTDLAGWGYTVFLPLRHPRPDLKRVLMQVKFVPENNKGMPLFSPPESISLGNQGPPAISSNILPGDAFVRRRAAQ